LTITKQVHDSVPRKS